MIQPLNAHEHSSVKSRTGLQGISELVSRLIYQYELQADMMKRRSEKSRLPMVSVDSTSSTQQATFGWFE